MKKIQSGQTLLAHQLIGHFLTTQVMLKIGLFQQALQLHLAMEQALGLTQVTRLQMRMGMRFLILMLLVLI